MFRSCVLLTLTGVLVGCDGGRFEKVHTGPMEEGKRYLIANDVVRCHVVITSEPDGCLLAGVPRDKRAELGRTPQRVSVDVRVKRYSDDTADYQIERVNESRNIGKVFRDTGIDLSGHGWRGVQIAYLFEKEGFVTRRFEDVVLSAEALATLPDRVFRVHAALDSESLALKPEMVPELQSDRANYECDVRLVEVSSGRAIRATTGRAENVAGFREMADRVVYKITLNLDAAPRAKVAVFDFEEIGDATVAGEYGRLAARMVATSLIRNGNYEVIERQQLQKLLQERNLTDAQVAEAPEHAGKVLGLDFVVLGSIAKVR